MTTLMRRGIGSLRSHAAMLRFRARTRTHRRRMSAFAAKKMPPATGVNRPRVGVFPAALHNPYFVNLYHDMSTEVVFLDNLLQGCELLETRRLTILHIHFLEDLELPVSNGNSGPIADEILKLLAESRCNGGFLAWTVHDSAPHIEPEYSPDLKKIRSWLARNADLVHVHRNAGRAVAEALGAPAQRIVSVAHPSYGISLGVPQVAAEPPLRRRFLSFGTIRPYSGIPAFIESLASAERGNNFGGYTIAGQVKARSEHLKICLHPGLGLRMNLKVVPDTAVAALFHEADFVVLPYRRSLTSGVAAIAMTMGVPVLGSDIGGMKEAVPRSNHRFLYSPDDPDAERAAIEAALTLPSAEHLLLQKECLAFAKDRAPRKQSIPLEAGYRALGLI